MTALSDWRMGVCKATSEASMICWMWSPDHDAAAVSFEDLRTAIMRDHSVHRWWDGNIRISIWSLNVVSALSATPGDTSTWCLTNVFIITWKYYTDQLYGQNITSPSLPPSLPQCRVVNTVISKVLSRNMKQKHVLLDTSQLQVKSGNNLKVMITIKHDSYSMDSAKSLATVKALSLRALSKLKVYSWARFQIFCVSYALYKMILIRRKIDSAYV